jgi:CBS domain-containing protein
MLIKDVLAAKSASLLTLQADRPLSDAAALMATRKVGSVVIVDVSRRPIGIVTEPDLVGAVSAEGAACLTHDARLAMRAPAKCGPDNSVTDALARMTRERARYLLVVDAGRLVGLVSIGDLVKARLEEAELESRVLRDMAHGAMLARA